MKANPRLKAIEHGIAYASSEFVFLIEYITEISNDFQSLLENKFIWENADEALLSEFLTTSGNTEFLEDAKSKILFDE